MRTKIIAGLFFGLVCLWQGVPTAMAETPAAQSQDSALNEVKTTLDEVIKVVTAYPTDKQLEQRRAKLRQVINPRFNFEEMSKRSLGTYWKEITPEQQKDFVTTFSDLLARTYLSKIETVQEGMVKFDGEKVDFPRALVKTIVKYKGDNFPLDYKLLNQDGSWKVYDVIIENIGLVANYRNEFAGIIRKESFEGLMKRLRDKEAA